MKNIIVFNSSYFGDLRVIKDGDGEPQFIASDVAKALGYRMASDMTRRLDRNEKDTRPVRTCRSGSQNMTVISEAGLYSAILGARVERAKPFKRWVTHEVLPIIRRDGGYMVAREDETDAELMARCILVAKRTIEDRNRRIATLEKENTQMLPSALAGESIADLDGTETIRAVVRYFRQKGLKVDYDIVCSEFRAHRYMELRSHAPTMAGIECGYLVQKQAVTANGQLCKPYARITAKGRAWLFDQLAPRYYTKKLFS